MNVVETFQKFVKSLEEKFRDDARVHALWLEGSYGGEHYDEFSDIDIWLDVKDESSAEIWSNIEEILGQFGKAKLLVVKPVTHNHEDRSYEIEGLPPTAHIDISVEKHSRVWWINEGDADPDFKIIFDKNEVIKHKKPDEAQQKSNRQTLAKQAYDFFQAYYKSGLIRNIKRGNYLEAVMYYLAALDQLMILIRLKYQPTKPDFGLKHITRDVPAKVQDELKNLYSFNSLDDLERNLPKIEKLIEAYAHSRD